MTKKPKRASRAEPEFFDLNNPDDARAYLQMWIESGRLSFEDSSDSIHSLDDERVVSIAKDVFLKADGRVLTQTVQ